MIAITGATGQLGRLVIQSLLAKVPASTVVAAVRRPDAAKEFEDLGVTVRHADYSKPETLASAFSGVETLLLISSSEVGHRATQHRAVIEAAKGAGVKVVVYTSILRADESPLELAVEHRDTEAALAASGLDHVVLRNGWYLENYAGSVQAAVAHGAVMGSAGEGRIAAASRADYAEAAATILAAPAEHVGQVYELAGDTGFTLTDLAAEIAAKSGKPVAYADMPPADYAAALTGVGVPGPMAAILADSDVGAAEGWLFDDGGKLSALIGRPTRPVGEMVSQVLAA